MIGFILKHKKLVVVTFFVLAIISIAVQFGVNTNSDMVDYLWAEAPSIKATDVTNEWCAVDVAHTSELMKDVSIQEELDDKHQLEDIDGVSGVMWLDDVMDIKEPIEMEDNDTVETYYKDGHALFSFEIKDGLETEATDEVYNLIGEDNAMS